MNDRLLRAARGEETDTTPIWIMRQAGRYLPEYRAIRKDIAFLDLCKNPDLASEVTVQPVKRLGVDAAIIFSDILIPSEAMGMELELGDKGPHFPSPLRTAADIEKLVVPDPVLSCGHLAEAIKQTRKKLSDSVPVIGFSGAPFTLAAYMVEGGGSKSFILIKRLMFEQPKLAHQLFQKLTDTLIPYLKMQVEAGAKIVQVFDSWGGELSPKDFRAFSLPYLKRIVSELKGTGVPVIFFGTALSTHLPILAELGADVVGLDWRIEMADGRRALGPKIAVQGNLDPLALFLPKDELRARAKEIVRAAGKTGHIFNLGHGILPPTDPDQAKVLVDAVHEEGALLRKG